MKRLMLFSAAVFAAITLFGANPTGRITERLNSFDGTWSNYQKVDYQYDNNGKVISEINFSWNYSEKAWAQSQKTEYRYADGKLAETTISNFTAYENAWQPLYRSEFMYEKNKTIEMVYSYNNYAGKTEDWTLLRKIVTVFKNGQKVSEDIFGWNAPISEYFVMSKSSFKYDSNGNLVEKLTGNSSATTPTQRTIYAYNAQKQLISEKIADINYPEKSSEYRYLYSE
ncbi:MAG: DUF3836 domain-containing protein [Prevotellaceae bacterium]|jgi:hypothetical protein|nr:DUF3836 domain-containing protein [Prevotellaceae bacterium]